MRNPFFNIKIPRLFKLLQKQLDIEEEWAIMRSNLWRHKFKLVFVSAACSYPLYRPYLQESMKYLSAKVNYEVESALQKDKPITQITQSFIKTVVVDSLKTEPIKRGGIDFAVELIKDK
jgi:hypothetical protein